MIVSLAGEWESYRSDELRERLEPAYSHAEVLLDLTAAKYVTSTLVGALVTAHEHRQAQGLPRMSVAIESAFVRRLFVATGLEEFFAIYKSLDEALKARASMRESA
ncbi:MAG: STAS domain-containing protein [Vulcanimicrobiaceae bacterium]